MLAVRPRFVPDPGEIAEVLEYPLARLVGAESEVEFRRGRHIYRGFSFEMGGNTIWGATGRILHQLIEVLRQGAGMSDASPYGPSDAELRSILGDARTIAVVGLSPKPHRDSYQVAEYLQRKGYRIIPVNPNATEVLGERAYASLLDVPEGTRIDVVDVFRRAEETPAVAADAVRRGAKVLWLQSGIVSDEARRIGEEAGLVVIMGVCIRTTSRRLEETV
jgi:predicted CoA-binding protein